MLNDRSKIRSKASIIDCCICGGIFNLSTKAQRVAQLERKMEESCFWDDNQAAQQVISEVNELKAWTVPHQELSQRFNNVKELLPEADEAGDVAFYEQLIDELQAIERILADMEIRKMLSGELDNKTCFLGINAGAGGTEACDWVSMLSRMYQRWAARRGWQVEILDFVDGEVAGLKSITFKIAGSFAYGYCKAERGVHRLVRISPFDSNARRHTSFASVDITPEIDDEIEIDIKPERNSGGYLSCIGSGRAACE